MIAILLAPVYLLANYYLLRRVMGWVKAWFPFFRTARHWALPVAVQAFLACSIVYGVLSILVPSVPAQISGSSMIRIDGSGIFLLLCVAAIAAGAALLLKSTKHK